jgi:hypothetical protein
MKLFYLHRCGGAASDFITPAFHSRCRKINPGLITGLMICISFLSNAQTDIDALMMKKNELCAGVMYTTGSWNTYWEGTLERENRNLGTVSTRMAAAMGNFGVHKNLNLLFGLPYVETKATGGTLKGFKGIQDLSVWAKWRALHWNQGSKLASLFALGGYSLPASDYVADYLPLSIGLRSQNAYLRGMTDLKYKTWFLTFSGTYISRRNITIDREAYYTNEMIYSNEVAMPDQTQLNLRMGYRGKELIVEWVSDRVTTLGGFDITRNNMPFPSNRMNMTRSGFQVRYEPEKLNGFTFYASANKVIDGRNVGKSDSYSAGVFYILNFSKKEKVNTENSSK